MMSNKIRPLTLCRHDCDQKGLLRLKLSRRSGVKEWPTNVTQEAHYQDTHKETTADNTQDVKGGYARGNPPRCTKYFVRIKLIQNELLSERDTILLIERSRHAVSDNH